MMLHHDMKSITGIVRIGTRCNYQRAQGTMSRVSYKTTGLLTRKTLYGTTMKNDIHEDIKTSTTIILPPKQPLPLWTKKYSELLRCEPVYEDCLQILYNELLPDYLASMTPP
jgi:hypothetical protein